MQLDIVDDLGADATGSEPINDALAEAVDNHDSVEVTFPDGTYVLHEGDGGDGFARWDAGAGVEEGRVGDVALIGEGDAVLKPPDGGRHNILTLWGRRLRIENFTVDQTGVDVSTGITAVAEEELVVRDILYDGKVTGPYNEFAIPFDGPAHVPDDYPEDPTGLIPAVLHSDGHGHVENVRMPDGIQDFGRKGAVWVNFVHAGDLRFSNCEFAGFSDNAIYGSPPGLSHGGGGSVRVEHSTFRNNNVTAIRLGTPGSAAENCTVVTEPGEIPPLPWGAITSRAGWVWYDFDGFYDTVEVRHDHPDGQGIFDHDDGTHDLSLDVRNCSIELNNDGSTALRAVDPGVTSVTVRNVTVSGAAGGGPAIDLANTEVDLSTFCIRQTGADRDGIRVANTTGRIQQGSIDVEGEDIVIDGDSNVAIHDIDRERHC